MTSELQHIIDSKRELLRRMTISRSPINYSEDMPSDQKDRKCPKFEVIANLEVESVVNTFAVIIHLKLSHYGNDRLRKRV